MQAKRRPLGQLMRERRKHMRYTLDAMVARTGLSKSTLWEMENNVQINPRHTTLAAVCRAYKLDIAAVLPPVPPSYRISE